MTMQPFLKAHETDYAVRLLKALANEVRLATVCELKTGELTVAALANRFGLSQSAMSQHLARLRRAGLVRSRRKGTAILYTLNNQEIARRINAIANACGP